jgi:hypothetical protein
MHFTGDGNLNNYKNCLLIIILLLLHPLTANAQGNISFNLYPWLDDVNTDSDFTVTTFIPLPHRFSYFSFVNIGGVLHSGSPKFIITEQNIRWNISEKYPVDFVAQDTIRNGHDNDTIHLGLRWRLNNTSQLREFFNKISLAYSFHVFPIRFDQRDLGGWQVSHVYTMTFPYISDRLYFSGFFDHNIGEGSASTGRRDNIVSENQFGVRLYKQFYAVLEYRFNEYRRNNKNNLGAGIELKTSW